jgi:hypothetical protein
LGIVEPLVAIVWIVVAEILSDREQMVAPVLERPHAPAKAHDLAILREVFGAERTRETRLIERTLPKWQQAKQLLDLAFELFDMRSLAAFYAQPIDASGALTPTA